MKKMMLVLTAALLATGTLLAQAQPPYPGSITGDKFSFDAVRTASTESRYTAGRFSSYVDDFIGVNDYNGGVRTFLFLGGFGSGNRVNQTDIPNVALSGGFATSIKSLYLGIYYGGDLIKGQGYDDGLSSNGTIYSEGIWNNYISILLGNLPFGALRLDMIMDNDTDTTRNFNGEKTAATGNGIMTALTWGINVGKLSPHISLGIQWPEYTFEKIGDMSTEAYSGASLGIKGGAGYTLNDTSSLSADAIIQFGFGEQTTVKSPDLKTTTNGDFSAFIDLGYSKTLALGEKLALGVKPNLTIALKLDNPDVTNSPGAKIDVPMASTVETKIGLDAGFQFKATRKFTLYTGASLNIFDWVAWGLSGGDPSRGGGSWQIRGLEFAPESLAASGGNSNLGFGLVYAPDTHLSIGCGINALLDKLFVVDFQNMEVRAGTFWSSMGMDHFLGNLLDGATIDLTVSYTY
jgi:hypothetical protein